MKKSIIFLLALGILSSNISAHTNKTFMRPTDSSFYMPKRFSFQDFYSLSKDQKLLDVELDVNVYHFFSSRANQVGKYFGVNEKNDFVLNGVQGQDTMDIPSFHLIQAINSDDGHNAYIKLLPQSNIAGANFTAIIGLDKLCKNLSFKFNLPYQRMHNDIRMDFRSDDNVNVKNIKEYLEGKFSSSTTNVAQAALQYAKITGRQENMGIPFLDFTLAYNMYNDKDIMSTVKASFIAPTERSAKGVYLFEPVLGNGDHFGVNVGVEGSKRIYNERRGTLDILWDLNYRYLFGATEKRTLGIKGANWGQYYLLGQNGAVAGTPLTPAANVLTQDLKVKPGSQLDLNLEALFGYHTSKFSVGGNVIAREREVVRLKTPFAAQTYGVAADGFGTTANAPFELTAEKTADNYSTYGLNENNIDLTVAETPSLFAFKAYAQYAYDYEKGGNKLFTVGLGGSINIADENSSLSGYGLWLNTAYYF